jgi:hypothetical protein
MRCVSGSTEALHSDGKPERIEKISKPEPAQMVQPGQVYLERPPSWHRKMPADPEDPDPFIASGNRNAQERAGTRFGESNGAQS